MKIDRISLETVVMNALHNDDDAAIMVLRMTYAKVSSDPQMKDKKKQKILASLLDAIEELMIIDIDALEPVDTYKGE